MQSGFSRLIITVALFLLSGAMSPLFAQFNDTMDVVLAQEKLTMGAASFLLLTGTGFLDDGSTLEQAAAALAQKIPEAKAAWDKEITLGEYSLYMMKLNRMKGGLMYALFPNGRYALRELRYLDVVQGQAFPAMSLSGERAARILGKLLTWKETGK